VWHWGEETKKKIASNNVALVGRPSTVCYRRAKVGTKLKPFKSLKRKVVFVCEGTRRIEPKVGDGKKVGFGGEINQKNNQKNLVKSHHRPVVGQGGGQGPYRPNQVDRSRTSIVKRKSSSRGGPAAHGKNRGEGILKKRKRKEEEDRRNWGGRKKKIKDKAFRTTFLCVAA